jgi:Zn-dependent M28 family amino/carboxypeptidase
MNSRLHHTIIGAKKFSGTIFFFKQIVASVLIAILFSSAVFAQRTVNAPPEINQNALRAHIRFLSDDLLEGRAPGQRGGNIAAAYVRAQFEAMGLRSGTTDGSYFQTVSLVGSRPDQNTQMTVRRGQGGATETFRFGEDFVAFTGAQRENVTTDAELVFVGYGIEAPEQRWNDYKGSPADYRGKILVMLVNDPPATQQEPNLFGGRGLTYYGRWTYKFEEAARRGAAGAILIHTDESAGYGWQVVRTSWGGWRYDIQRTPEDRTPYLDLKSWVTDATARRMMQMAGQDLDALRRQAATRDFRPVPLGMNASITIRSEMQQSNSPNVAAVLPGRDERLRDEYVIYTGHYDHLGVGTPNAQGDRIYNGALDNATGVSAILTIAHALSNLPAAQRPRRSILFLITTAEEQGLLGAEWYAARPLVPLERTVANINIDGVNILGRTSDYAALGAERSTLQAVVEAVARERGMTVSPDPRPEQGSFYRSDHFPLAKVGIPAISLRDGSNFIGRPAGWGEEQFRLYNTQHYHQPSDEMRPTWSFEGMVQQTEIAFTLGRRIADANERPRYNPNDEFARARGR